MTESRPRRPHSSPAKKTKPASGSSEKPASGSSEKPASRVSPARLAAFHILSRVSQGKGHSDDLLYGPDVSQLSQEDRNLATTLVLGTLRWQIALDASVRPLLQRPDVVPAEPVLIALRLGIFQLKHLDRIPAHAAINESVELARESGNPHAAGMVNAILRKLATAPEAKKKLHESTAAFAERLGHPAWIVERWVANYGRDVAMAICGFDQQEPASGNIFTAQGEEETAGLPRLPQVDDGSRLVAEIASVSAPHAQRIWDCCAAPGGKTLILAHHHPQATLLATDLSPRRLQTLVDRLRKEAPEAKTQTLVSDVLALPADQAPFDLILCDVPCSGTGTLARNPEIRHQLRLSDLSRQAERQRAILSAALKHLAPGGRLVYSTCSLEPEENERVVEDVLHKTGGDFHQEPVEPLLQELKAQGVLTAGTDLSAILRNRFLRTLPGHNFQGDGFFATVLTKA